jgi:hypothetical protein
VVDRRRAQAGLRVVGLVLVVAWLFSGRLQAILPFWLPFAILAATESEFVLRGWWEARRPTRDARQDARERRLPGEADADLGWVEAVDEDGLPVLVPAPPRVRRRSWSLPALAGLSVAVGLFALALRVDRRDTWDSLTRAKQAQTESRLSSAAESIARRRVTIRCDNSYSFTGVGSDAAGVAFPRQALAYLEPTVCRSLYDLSFAGKLGTRDGAAWALTVLAHEATHLRGIQDEARTECFALQEGAALGERLGLAPAVARALMREQLGRDLSDTSVARLDYRLPAGCRNGGALDLRQDDASFP